MGLTVLRPVLWSDEVIPEPVRPTVVGGRLIAVAVLATVVVPLVAASADPRPGVMLLFGAIVVVVVVVVVIAACLWVMSSAPAADVVRVDPNAAALRFTPSPATTGPTVVMTAALALPAVAQAVVDAAGFSVPFSPLFRVLPYLLAVTAVVMLAVRVRWRHVPSGLELTDAGLRGIRGVSNLAWRWDDLADATVIAAPTSRLRLLAVDGRAVVVAPAVIGSDPHLVAIVVQFYLARPADRAVSAAAGSPRSSTCSPRSRTAES